VPCPDHELAASAVLAFERVAACIPNTPAIREQIAPVRNATDDIGLSRAKKSKRNTTTTKIAMILYSRFKKTMAPSCILSMISTITSLPGEKVITYL